MAARLDGKWVERTVEQKGMKKVSPLERSSVVLTELWKGRL